MKSKLAQVFKEHQVYHPYYRQVAVTLHRLQWICDADDRAHMEYWVEHD